MRPHLTRLLLLGCLIAASGAVASPAAAAQAVNLIANPGFEADLALASWSCDSSVDTKRNSGGSEFMQVRPRDDEEPGTLALAKAAEEPLSGMQPALTATSVIGTPTETERANCTQAVPVRPGTTYTLSAKVSGGLVFLGTEFGSIWAPAAPGSRTLRLTFATPADVDQVHVYFHGWYGGEPFKVDNVVLSGPESESRPPVAPTRLVEENYTSRALELSWLPSPGATAYRVYRDGELVRTLTGTWTPVYGLTGGRPYRFTVEAVNAAGGSGHSEPLIVESTPLATEAPAVPENPRGEYWGGGQVFVRWWAEADATDGHYLYVNGERAGWVRWRKALFTDLAPGTYTIEVSSLNMFGESARSEPVEVTVPRSVAGHSLRASRTVHMGLGWPFWTLHVHGARQ